MFVAFATTGEGKINAHFGMATDFAVYDIGSESCEFSKMLHLPEQAQEDDKVEIRAELLKECIVVYCTHIGSPAAARLVQSGIQPLKAPEGTPIAQELQRLRTMLKETPPPWLRKRLMEEMNHKEESCQCPFTRD